MDFTTNMATSMNRTGSTSTFSSSHDTSYGDQEQDANMALTELDKGLYFENVYLLDFPSFL